MDLSSVVRVRANIRRFFFDQPAVRRAVNAAARGIFAHFGWRVMRSARASIKAGRRKTLAELTPAERQSYRIQQEYWRRGRRGKPRLARRESAPGEPPHNVTGLLKRFIYFAYDPWRRSVVIGPEAKGPRTADALEYGGAVRRSRGPRKGEVVNVAARPYMWPAFIKNRSALPAMWRDSVKPSQ
jgi:hypothetical protein